MTLTLKSIPSAKDLVDHLKSKKSKEHDRHLELVLEGLNQVEPDRNYLVVSEVLCASIQRELKSKGFRITVSLESGKTNLYWGEVGNPQR